MCVLLGNHIVSLPGKTNILGMVFSKTSVSGKTPYEQLVRLSAILSGEVVRVFDEGQVPSVQSGDSEYR